MGSADAAGGNQQWDLIPDHMVSGLIGTIPQADGSEISVDEKGFSSWAKDKILFGTPGSFVYVPEHLDASNPTLPNPHITIWAEGEDGSLEGLSMGLQEWGNLFGEIGGEANAAFQNLVAALGMDDLLGAAPGTAGELTNTMQQQRTENLVNRAMEAVDEGIEPWSPEFFDVLFPPGEHFPGHTGDMADLLDIVDPPGEFMMDMKARLEAQTNAAQFVQPNIGEVQSLLDEIVGQIAPDGVTLENLDQVMMELHNYIADNFTVDTDDTDNWGPVTDVISTMGGSPEGVANLQGSLMLALTTRAGIASGMSIEEAATMADERVSLHLGKHETGDGAIVIGYTDARGVARAFDPGLGKQGSIFETATMESLRFDTFVQYNTLSTDVKATIEEMMTMTTGIAFPPEEREVVVNYLAVLAAIYTIVAKARDRIQILDAGMIEKNKLHQLRLLADKKEASKAKIEEIRKQYRKQRIMGPLMKLLKVVLTIVAVAMAVFDGGASIIAVTMIFAAITALEVVANVNVITEFADAIGADEGWVSIAFAAVLIIATAGAAAGSAASSATSSVASAAANAAGRTAMQVLPYALSGGGAIMHIVDKCCEPIEDDTVKAVVKGILVTLIMIVTIKAAAKAKPDGGVAVRGATQQPATTAARGADATGATSSFQQIKTKLQDWKQQLAKVKDHMDDVSKVEQGISIVGGFVTSGVGLFSSIMNLRIAQHQEIIADLNAILALLTEILGQAQGLTDRLLDDLSTLTQDTVGQLRKLIESAIMEMSREQTRLFNA